ncbi:hypothetical protein HPB47_012109, partial [Ixodes persulcatus]
KETSAIPCAAESPVAPASGLCQVLFTAAAWTGAKRSLRVTTTEASGEPDIPEIKARFQGGSL